MIKLKTYALLSFRRIRASQPFTCCDCGKTIEPKQFYHRLIAKFKYCDKCFIVRLNRHGWGYTKNKFGFGLDMFWYMKPNTLEEQLNLLQSHDGEPQHIGRPKSSLNKGSLLNRVRGGKHD